MQAKDGRAHILANMMEAIDTPREASLRSTRRASSPSRSRPTRSATSSVPGGKVIRGIQEETGAQIDVQEDGTIYIAARDLGGEEASKRIQLIVKEPEIGEKYTGRVVSIQSVRRLHRAHARQGRPAAHLARGQGPRGQGRGRPQRRRRGRSRGSRRRRPGKISLDRVNKPDAPEGTQQRCEHRGSKPHGDRDARSGGGATAIDSRVVGTRSLYAGPHV